MFMYFPLGIAKQRRTSGSEVLNLNRALGLSRRPRGVGGIAGVPRELLASVRKSCDPQGEAMIGEILKLTVHAADAQQSVKF